MYIELPQEILITSLKTLDDTWKYLYQPKGEFMLCGDINTDYLHESNWKKYLSSLQLITYPIQ